ncbi:MAG: hypothetical protein GY777_03500 [Candidatus Brocadiaceae bacterium]|nr:hypothetical protein [Candidatus Brocadiaceae bacterium]
MFHYTLANNISPPYNEEDKLKIKQLMNEIITEHRDLSLYPELMGYYRNKLKLSFFPKEVSGNNKLSYREGFMQGGQWIYLRQKTTPRKISELTNIVRNKENIFSYSSRQNLNRKMPVDKFSKSTNNQYHQGWVVYLISNSTPENWNHGHIYGIAINSHENLVDYFHEIW